MKGGLKQSVNEHLAERELDEAQLRRFAEMQDRSHMRRGRQPYLLGGALAALLVIAVALLWPRMQVDPLWEIADEVAYNHLLQRPLEAKASTVAELQPYFRELNFRLVESSLDSLLDVAMQGGRYCSVKGVKAAQLRLLDEQPASRTLYQVPYDAALFGRLPDTRAGEVPAQVQVRGVSVEVWVEKGLLMALVHE